MRKVRSILIAALLATGCGADGERTESPRDVAPVAQRNSAPGNPGPAANPSSPPILGSSNPTAPGSPQPAAAVVSPAPTAPAGDPVVARLDDIVIKQSQITRPLIEGYGLNVLLNTATLELTRQEAASRKMVVTPAEIAAEREQTLAKMFGDAKKEDYPNLFEQFIQQQRISRPEFDIVIETNTYLRKIAEPVVKAGITDQRLRESFNALYGETVLVRHIQCANPQEITEAKRKLAAGEPFEQVARELSRNARSREQGGELPPFSRFATGYPDQFKDLAFALKVGEVSDPVQTGDAYHLIKLEKRIAPKAVNFEDVKESLREDLVERLTQAQVKTMRAQLVDRIELLMKVDDAGLAKQFEAKKTQTDSAVKGKKEALDAIKKDGDKAVETAPKPEGLQPPATMPGAAAPGQKN